MGPPSATALHRITSKRSGRGGGTGGGLWSGGGEGGGRPMPQRGGGWRCDTGYVHRQLHPHLRCAHPHHALPPPPRRWGGRVQKGR